MLRIGRKSRLLTPNACVAQAQHRYHANNDPQFATFPHIIDHYIKMKDHISQGKLLSQGEGGARDVPGPEQLATRRQDPGSLVASVGAAGRDVLRTSRAPPSYRRCIGVSVQEDRKST